MGLGAGVHGRISSSLAGPEEPRHERCGDQRAVTLASHRSVWTEPRNCPTAPPYSEASDGGRLGKDGSALIILGVSAAPYKSPRRRAGASGCSSGVEHNLAKVGVVGSNPIARSKIPLADQGFRAGLLRRAFLVYGIHRREAAQVVCHEGFGKGARRSLRLDAR